MKERAWGDGVAQRFLGLVAPNRFGAEAPEDTLRTMAAVVYARHGPAEVLEYRPAWARPRPTRAQVLVRILAAGLNPVDLKLRDHALPALLLPLPKIPGTDFAGEVVCAPRGSRFAPGSRVFGMMPLLGTPWGACAQFLAIEDRFLAQSPPHEEHLAVASLPLVSLTVMQGLRGFERAARGKTRGKRALVHGGSGGVGSFAVQYCASVLGMDVTATCSARNAARVQSLGARTVIDYAAEDWTLAAGALDLIIDPWGYEEQALAAGVLAPGGFYVRIASSHQKPERPGWTIPEATLGRIMAGFTRQVWRNVRARVDRRQGFFRLVYVHPDGSMLAQVARHVEAGRIRPTFDRSFALRETIEAHRYLESGLARGKVVIALAHDQQ